MSRYSQLANKQERSKFLLLKNDEKKNAGLGGEKPPEYFRTFDKVFLQLQVLKSFRKNKKKLRNNGGETTGKVSRAT